MNYFFYLLLIDFLIKYSSGQKNVYCDLSQNCNDCEICGKEKGNYCSCSFYNIYCKNEETNDYSFFSDFLFHYDGCITSNRNIEDICGKSNIDIEIGANKAINFQSSEYTNFFCFYNVKKVKNNNNEINIKIKKETNEYIFFNMHLVIYNNYDNQVKTFTRLNVLGSSNNLEIIEIEAEKISVYIDIPDCRYMDKISISFGLGKNTVLKKVKLTKNSSKISERLFYGIPFGLFGLLMFLLIICLIIKCRARKKLNYNNRNNSYLNQIEKMPSNKSIMESNKQKINNLFKTILTPKLYSKINDINDCIKCTICQENFKERSSFIVTTKCKHSFHFNCFKKWVYKNIYLPKCPNCNEPILEENSKNIASTFSTNENSFPNNDYNTNITGTFGVSF